MKINLVFDYGTDVVEVPDFVGENVKKYRERFDKWCFDKNNKTTFDRKTGAFCYDGSTFVDWLNKYELQDNEKAEITESGPYDLNRKGRPTLFF